MKALLQNRVVLLLLGTDLLEQLGIWIRNIALLFYVMEATGNSPAAVSLLTVMEIAPILLFSLIGGALADRWEPKRTMRIGQLLSAVSVIVILLLVNNGVWQAVFAATAISAIVSQFSQPSTAVMIKHHLPPELIPVATGLSQSLISLFLIAGPIIGTGIYTWMGLNASLLLIIALFLVSFCLISFLPALERIKPDTDKASLLAEVKDGIGVVFHSPVLSKLALAFGILGLGTGLVQPLDIFVITERLQLQKEQVQWFYLASGAGMLGGGLLSAYVMQNRSGRLPIFYGLCFLSLSLIVEVLSVWPLLTAAFRLGVGFSLAFVQAGISIMIITLVEERFIGRVSGAITPLFTGTLLVGAAVSGIMVEATSLFAVYFAAAFITLLAAAYCLLLPTTKACPAAPIGSAAESGQPPAKSAQFDGG